MKSRMLLVVMSLVLFLGASSAVAQWEDDPGIPDTVRLGCPTIADLAQVPPGDSIKIPVYIWSDYELSGFGIGVTFDYDYVVIQSIDTNGSALDATQRQFFQQAYNPEDRHGYIGWIPLNPSLYFAPTGADTGAYMFSFNMKVLEGISPVCIELDSAFAEPSRYFVLSVDTMRNSSTFNVSITPAFVNCSACLDVAELESPVLPESFSLSQNTPNPFNPATNVDFAVPRSTHVTINVYNTLGQRVRTLVDEYLKAGFKRVQWDGTNDYGDPVASGIYFYRMTADGFSESKKMMLLK